MTTNYVSSLMARVYRLDRMLLEAKRNGDLGVVELVEEYLDDTMVELKEAEHMEEVAHA